MSTDSLPPLRVMVVDDAVVVRRMLAAELGKHPELEVVGTAANGRICLRRVPKLDPELIVLDLEMPELNGLETLVELRRRHPKVRVIVFTAQSESNAKRGLEAISMGAQDVISKGSDELLDTVDTLTQRILAVCGRTRTCKQVAPATAVRPPTLKPVAVNALVIASSTGGPNALAEVLGVLPPDFPVPICIVQHMPKAFTGPLAERLERLSAIEVREAQGGEHLHPGLALIAPGGAHLVLDADGDRVITRIDHGPPEHSCRPSAEPLIRSAVERYGPGVLLCVLTGMGDDASEGAQLVHDAGGQVIVQDQASSVVWGMPGWIACAGLADAVVPLSEVGQTLIQTIIALGQRRAG
jgi:two-component system, chemotaxis family, protein-glutamate methylesterase/glutaminase